VISGVVRKVSVELEPTETSGNEDSNEVQWVMAELPEWAHGTPSRRPDMNTPAQELTGIELDGGWKVLELLKRDPKATGGNFSVGYVVESSSGDRAYLKALDYS